MALGLIEQLTRSTVRLESKLSTGGTSTGSGFYMHLLASGNDAVPVIITNKHVIKNATTAKIHVTLRDKDGEPDPNQHMTYDIPNFEAQCIKHPDPDVDLAAFPIAPLITQATADGVNLFYMPLHTDIIPTQEEREDFSTMEDILMIGYPNGIWDAVHNMPVIRKGITATHPAIFCNGKPEFLTDIASFPGSSGSPVFLVNIGSYMDKAGNTYMGTSRVKLLGIHYAGFMHTAAGQIQIVPAPTANVPMPITQIPNNIGVAINSLKILELEAEIKRIVGL